MQRGHAGVSCGLLDLATRLGQVEEQPPRRVEDELRRHGICKPPVVFRKHEVMVLENQLRQMHLVPARRTIRLPCGTSSLCQVLK